VRRAGWFFHEGSVLKPCDENLATQVEEGYIKLKPFRTQPITTTKVTADDKENPLNASPQFGPKDSDDKTTRSSSPFRFSRTATTTQSLETAKKEMIWKLLGDQHMGKYVVYTGPTTAWLLSNDVYGKLTSSVYQTLTAGVHLGGAKLVRGYVEQSKTKEKEPVEPKPTNEAFKGSVSRETVELDADKAEEKEMEEDYDDSEKEDPTR